MINTEKSIMNKRFLLCYVVYFQLSCFLSCYLLFLFLTIKLHFSLHSSHSYHSFHSIPSSLPFFSFTLAFLFSPPLIPPPLIPSLLLLFIPFLYYFSLHHRAGVCLMSKFSNDFNSKSNVTTPSSPLLTFFLGIRLILVGSSMGVYDEVSDRSYSERTDRNSSVQPIK